MLIEDIINEAADQAGLKKLVLYPGRFQPPHIGHMNAWKWLKDQFGDAYVVTSDKVDPPRRPFNFNEKRRLLMHAGVPSNRIVQTKSPYRADELVGEQDPDNTVLIFAVSQKDMDEDPRFSFRPKKDGSPSYFQSFKEHQGSLQPLSKHGYIAVVPTFPFKVAGNPMRSATEFRSDFAQATDTNQARMIKDLYGSYDAGIHQLMKEKIV